MNKRIIRMLGLVATMILLTACGSTSSSIPTPTVTVTARATIPPIQCHAGKATAGQRSQARDALQAAENTLKLSIQQPFLKGKLNPAIPGGKFAIAQATKAATRVLADAREAALQLSTSDDVCNAVKQPLADLIDQLSQLRSGLARGDLSAAQAAGIAMNRLRNAAAAHGLRITE